MTELTGRHRARIDGFTHGGEGVARVEGKAVFVAGTLPGEHVELEVVEDHARWARGRLRVVHEAAPGRVSPPCPHAEVCGGCDLQHVDPEVQRQLKTRVVREQLTRLGRLTDPPVADCVAVGPDLGYRTHARLHADADGRLGYHRAGTHEVVPVAACPILAPAAQAVRDRVGDGSGAQEVAVRGHDTTGAAAARIRPGTGPLEVPDGPFDVVLEQPDGRGLAWRGEGTLSEQVAGFTFRFDTTSFFQVSPGGAEAIVDRVLHAVGDVTGTLTWDLYAGVGLLSLPLTRAGAEVVAVEGHGPATEWATTNAEAAGLDLRVVHAPVGSHVATAARRPGGDLDAPEVVVLDPPRAGAGARVLRDLAALGPARIVYVACDVAALARDARELTALGYGLARAEPLDLFPMTHHVETVATFLR